jgi:hypothetical protein
MPVTGSKTFNLDHFVRRAQSGKQSQGDDEQLCRLHADRSDNIIEFYHVAISVHPVIDGTGHISQAQGELHIDHFFDAGDLFFGRFRVIEDMENLGVYPDIFAVHDELFD